MAASRSSNQGLIRSIRKSSGLEAVWLLRKKRTIAHLEYWLTIVGYNPKKHAFDSRIYMIYVIIFFSVWIFAVLTLFAGFAGSLLRLLPFASPLVSAVAVGAVVVLGLLLFELNKATRRWMRNLAPAVFILLAVGVYLSMRQAPGFTIPAWLAPLTYSLYGGLGAAPFWPSLLISLLWALAGLILLGMAARQMSLARAAQETRGVEALQAAAMFGTSDQVREMRSRQKMGAGRQASWLPAKPGPAALLWRNAIQEGHWFGLRNVFIWSGIFAVALGILIFRQWEPLILAIGLEIWFSGQLVVADFRRDLSRWWLLHQLPYALFRMTLIDLTIPFAILQLLVAGALIAAALIGVPFSPLAAAVLIVAPASITFSATLDILFQCRLNRLLTGNVPEVSFLTIIFSALTLGIPLVLAWLIGLGMASPVVPSLVTLLLSALMMDSLAYVLIRTQVQRIN